MINHGKHLNKVSSQKNLQSYGKLIIHFQQLNVTISIASNVTFSKKKFQNFLQCQSHDFLIHKNYIRNTYILYKINNRSPSLLSLLCLPCVDFLN